MTINLHQLLLVIKLNILLFDIQLNLLIKHPAFIGVVRRGIVPFEPFLSLVFLG
jgi:hypothetical protein